MQIKPDENQSILFFDGYCGLCNKLVDFILTKKTRERILLAPLQGSTAKKTLAFDLIAKNDTVVFYHGGRFHLKSNAILHLFSLMFFPWSLVSVFFIAPKFFRDMIYDIFARKRYRWFKKKDNCRLPNQFEKEHFLP